MILNQNAMKTTTCKQVDNQVPPNPNIKVIRLLFCNSTDMQIQDHQNFNHNSPFKFFVSILLFNLINFFWNGSKSKIITPSNNFSQRALRKKHKTSADQNIEELTVAERASGTDPPGQRPHR